MHMIQPPEFYHAGEDVADDGKTIVAVINQHNPPWASCWDKRVCAVPRSQVAEVVRRLNRSPELVGLLQGMSDGLAIAHK
jgi:hypothetical protein